MAYPDPDDEPPPCFVTTPFEPGELDLGSYDRSEPLSAQAPGHARRPIPRAFLDAIFVRERVFVVEQQVPLENELDDDDERSCHWVIYATTIGKSSRSTHGGSVDDSSGASGPDRDAKGSGGHKTDQGGEEEATEEEAVSLAPVGTIRLVPFPHATHPRDGDVYAGDKLVRRAGAGAGGGGGGGSDGHGPEKRDMTASLSGSCPAPEAPALTALPSSPDRATALRDGREPYVKLGRLAVLPAFRRRGLAGRLIWAALDWMREHPDRFDRPGSTWRGLVCCHAQTGAAVEVWRKAGFEIDEAMGTWIEEGISHVGMFLRLGGLGREQASSAPEGEGHA